MRRVIRALVTALGVCALASCGGASDAEPTLQTLVIAIQDGDGQAGIVGEIVATAPSVKATRGGTVVAGITVSFAIASGGGTVTGGNAVTDATGIARAGQWTLGTTSGTHTLTAQSTGAQGSPLTFTATAAPGSARTATKQGGDQQTSAAGVAVTTRPALRVVDQFGNAVPGVQVTFAVTQGNGSVSGGSQTTGSDGIATIGTWTLGPVVGANAVSATVSGTGIIGSPAVFTATGIAGAAANVVKQGGDAQNATVGTSVVARPAVRVTDQFGNPVSGATVTFAVATGGGSVTGATSGTGIDGISAAGSWTLGTTAGPQTLTATVLGAGVAGNPATFTATAVAGAPSVVVKVAGDAQQGPAGVALGIRPSIKVTDQFGNATGGVAVTFTVTAGAGIVSGGQQTTGPDGLATIGSWTIGQVAGANALRATATGSGLTGNPADFTATGIAGPAAFLTKQAGDAQSILAGTPAPIAPSVRLTDVFGNAILGQTVNFALVGGGGAISGASPATNNAGVATLGGWTFGAVPGPNAVTASAGGFNIIFNGTGLALLDAVQYAGTYNGTWTNTTFGSVGTGTATIVDNGGLSNASVTIAATGNVLGTPGGIPATQRVTPYTPVNGAFNGNIPQLGNVVFTLTSTTTPGLLNIVASGTGIPNLAISRWDATGTITPTQLQLNFTVTFVVGAPAIGTIVLNKP